MLNTLKWKTIQNLHLNNLKKITWLVTGVLVLVAVLAPAALASEREELIVFTTLRADIEALVPEIYHPSFLAKVGEAEVLLSGIQAPSNPCASSHVLTALRNENQAVSGTNGYLERDAAIIDTDITDLLEIIVPPNPC